ncbi:MAG: hypothetical protein AAGE18_18315 [Pseudomonadota bacterium]
MRIGLLPLGRATFDVPFAEDRLAAMLAVLDGTGHEVAGPRTLLFDGPAVAEAQAGMGPVDLLLLLQVTFTDAAATVAAAEAHAGPLAIWAVPEPRLGGRLRLNAFCGLNLASHALGQAGRPFAWLYAEPHGAEDAVAELIAGSTRRPVPEPRPAEATEAGQALAARLSGRRIARIGAHPDGFSTCAYDPTALARLAGVTVDEIALPTLFETARQVAEPEAKALHRTAATLLADLETVDAGELDRSLRLRAALDRIRAERDYDAFALRCWPETFTEYGGAVCGPVSMLGEARVPCACEADVYGALSQLALQEAAGAPVFLADLVDMDEDDDTGVVWHCGQAPASMAHPAAPPRATIHTNRRMPLLFEFALKPGPVTFARISQTRGGPRMVLAAGEMLDRPMAFTGTSGVVRFSRPVADVLPDLIACGLEHHMALAYGDHRPALRGLAGALDLPVLEL